MVVVKLLGGLGNQMFQLATGISLAKRLKADLFLDVRTFFQEEESSNETKRELQVDRFLLPEFKILDSDLAYSDLLEKKSRFIFPMRWKSLLESGCHFHHEIMSIQGNIILDGFWQSERYFKNIRDYLTDFFTIADTKSLEDISHIVALIRSTKSVSLHVRRGDYVSNDKAARIHGTCSLKFYRESILMMQLQVDVDCHYFIFTDDIEWCESNISPMIMNSVIVSTFTNGLEPFIDMYLMSICEHNILSNSSFSWWGGWLNKNLDKHVICPSRWTLDDAYNHDDRIPENWLKLNPRLG